jgi:hypothetical protein
MLCLYLKFVIIQVTSCALYGSQNLQIISPPCINWLAFKTEKESVYCSVRAESLNKVQVNFRFHYISIQSKFLRTIVNAPWYVSNQLLHNDLHIPSITNEIQRVATKYNNKMYNHTNDLIEHLYNNGPIDRRLRRTWPADLVQRLNNDP